MSQRPTKSTRTTSKAKKATPGWQRTINQWGGLPVLGSIAIALVVVGALIFFNRPSATEPEAVVSTSPQVAVNGRVQGSADAPVKIVEYADFQCPFCKRWVVETGPLIASEFVATGQVQLEYRYFAFLGEESKKAAEAAECAADQGRFWEMHDVLYAHQPAKENSGGYKPANLKKYAAEVAAKAPGFDTAKFATCLDGGGKRAFIDQMAAQAAQVGVRSTPSFTVNGQLIVGAQPIDVFRAAIANAKAAKP